MMACESVLKVNFSKTYNSYFWPQIYCVICHIVITLKCHCYWYCGCLRSCGVRKDSRQYTMGSAHSAPSQQLRATMDQYPTSSQEEKEEAQSAKKEEEGVDTEMMRDTQTMDAFITELQ